MCATVIVENIDPIAPRWDRDRVAVILGRGLSYLDALNQVRVMLAYLGAPQQGLTHRGRARVTGSGCR